MSDLSLDTLDIHSTDPTLPQSKLTFRAQGAKLFALSPKEVNLNKMSWNDQREFSVTVSSPLQKDWQIVGMDEADDAFDISWEKSQVGDRTQWTIKGKYGPLENGQPGGGVLRFRTDVNGAATFDVRVLAYVTGPLDVKPGGFLTLELKAMLSGWPPSGSERTMVRLAMSITTSSPDVFTKSWLVLTQTSA